MNKLLVFALIGLVGGLIGFGIGVIVTRHRSRKGDSELRAAVTEACSTHASRMERTIEEFRRSGGAFVRGRDLRTLEGFLGLYEPVHLCNRFRDGLVVPLEDELNLTASQIRVAKDDGDILRLLEHLHSLLVRMESLPIR